MARELVLQDTPIVWKLNNFIPLQEDDLQELAKLLSKTREVSSHTDLLQEGGTNHHCYFLVEGWGCRYKLLSDGRRQIIDFPIPGDLLGYRSSLLRTRDHSFATITPAALAEVPANQLTQAIAETPRLGQALLWAVSRDEAIIVEHLVNLGRRTALERTAHFLLELGERLRLAGLVSDHNFSCPLTQDLLGDALGLSSVHVNRVLRQLRERELVTLRHKELVIHDTQGLRTLAGFDIGYLDQE
jgi:CRP-like cAMP-binding protein